MKRTEIFRLVRSHGGKKGNKIKNRVVERIDALTRRLSSTVAQNIFASCIAVYFNCGGSYVAAFMRIENTPAAFAWACSTAIMETLTHAWFISGGRNCSRITPASSAIVSRLIVLSNRRSTRTESLHSSSRYNTP